MDLDLTGIPKSDREDAKQDVIDFIIETILEDASESKSSVSGHRWKGLSKAYKAVKSAESSSVTANLELTGDMLDALQGESRSGSKIAVGFFDADEAIKAYNHNVGDTLPKRQTIPSPSEDFRPAIRKGIDEILEGYRGNISQDEE